MAQYDLILQGGRYFDGSCTPSAIRSLAIKDGRIALVSAEPLDPALAGQVIEVQGKWITPGFLDTHTHYDAELIVAPSLSESVRHGVTTVLVGSCSLSMVCSEAEDASDIFTRVETVPREKVLPILHQHKSWSSPAQWRAFVDHHPLGPNLISFLGHSDLRVAVMGLHRATDRQVTPSEAELQRMEALLEEALDCGFLGLSTMCLKWDKIDGDREWSKSLPSTYARWREVRRLNRLLRRRGRVHQGAPNAPNPLQITQYIGEAIGLLRKPLKTTLISLLDLKGNRSLALLARFSAWLTNRLGGDFRWQLLPTPFAIYADGMDIVLFEEFGAGPHLVDVKDQLEPTIMALSFIFLLVGYGTKVGLAPLHNWLPDAHAEGPTPVSAVLSGLLLNVALYAILRCKVLADGALPEGYAGQLMIGFGLVTLLMAAFFLSRQKDVKRMFAYS